MPFRAIARVETATARSAGDYQKITWESLFKVLESDVNRQDAVVFG
jgi:hypothetical protein